MTSKTYLTAATLFSEKSSYRMRMDWTYSEGVDELSIMDLFVLVLVEEFKDLS